MKKEDVEHTISQRFRQRTEPAAPFTEAEWAELEAACGCQLPVELRFLLELMPSYWFEGDFLQAGDAPGDDTILSVYRFECSAGRWDRDLIPIYSVGNGDYVCLRASEGAASRVYYTDHETEETSPLSRSVGEWVAEWFS